MTESVEWERLADLTRLRDVEKQLAETSTDGAQWQARATAAERELAELRSQLAAEENKAVLGSLPREHRHSYRVLMGERDEARKELAELRERIAAELERISDKCGAKAEDYADERSPGLEAAESAYWDAARRIRSGEMGRVVENGSEEGEWKAADDDH